MAEAAAALLRTPNLEQQRVIDDFTHNIILFASAGTGKTFTIAQKIAAAVRGGVCRPADILCLTFTVKACNEMAEDVAVYTQGLDSDGAGAHCYTIHGFCYYLIKSEAKAAGDKYAEPSICDEVDSEQILQEIILPQALGRQPADNQPLTRVKLFYLVGAVKRYRVLYNMPRQPGVWRAVYELLRENEPQLFENLFSFSHKGSHATDYRLMKEMDTHIDTLVEAYNSYLLREDRLDYNDLIIQAWEYLQQEDVRRRWQARFRLVFIDEMQDISTLEYEVIKCLLNDNQVVMCGDYFQSIYGWRGAEPDLVLADYVQRYRAKRYTLTRNYRSTQLLANACFGYLKNAYGARIRSFYPDEMQAARADGGARIDYYTLPDAKAEAEKIFSLLRAAAPEERAAACVMARSNRYIRMLWEQMNVCNALLPEPERLRFFTVGEDLNLFKRTEIKDILAYLRLVADPYDAVAFEWVIRKYLPAVTPYVLRKLRQAGASGVAVSAFLQQASYTDGDPYAPLLALADGRPTVVFDTETTGLDLAKDEIIQVAAARIDADGNVLAQQTQFIQPSRPVSAAAERVHGYSDSFLRAHGVAPAQALARFREFCAGAVLVGHNSAAFDLALIERQLAENNLPPLQIRAHFDTMQIAKLFYPELEHYRLETLCGKMGVVNERAHDAFADVAATARVLAFLLREKLLPSAEKRRQIVRSLTPRFTAFYAFYQELRNILARGTLDELAAFAAAHGGVRGRYAADAEKSASIDDLLEIAAVKAKAASQYAALHELLLGASLSGSELDLLLRETRKIPIITVHQAKGCEFRTVFLAGVDEMNFPSFAARQTAGGEADERRLFYVALSRAKEKLILTRHRYAISLRGNSYEQAESPYLADIPEDAVIRYESC